MSAIDCNVCVSLQYILYVYRSACIYTEGGLAEWAGGCCVDSQHALGVVLCCVVV